MSDRERLVPGALERTAAWTWRLLLVGGAVVLLAWVAAQLYLITLPLIVAVIVATLVVPPVRWLQRRGVPGGLATAIVVIGGLAALVGLIALLAPSFVEQILELRPAVVGGWETFLTWLEEGPLGIDRARLNELIAQAGRSARASSSRIISGVASGAVVVAELLASLVLLVVLLFFLVKDRREIVGWFLTRTPERRRDTVHASMVRAWEALSGYVRGTAAIALIDAVGIGIGLLLLGVPLVLPLAVLVFLGAFLPVVGAFLAGLVAVLVAAADGGLGSAIAVLILIVAVQQVEGNVLQPVIMRRSVALHPVVILIVLTAGASIAGIVGAFLSVPIAAVVAAIGNELRVRAERGVPASLEPQAPSP